MLRWVLINVILACLPSVLMAQQNTIRTGEHAGFTRLVAPLPPGSEWQVDHVDQTVTFSLSERLVSYDLGTVFDLITRDRIAEISSNEAGFTLVLGCDCKVAPFVVRDRYVVLDITSPNTSRPVPFVSHQSNVVAAVTVTKDLLPENGTPGAAIEDFALPVAPATRSSPEPEPLPALARLSLSSDEQEALDEIQQRLARELGSAATRGVLTPLPGATLPKAKRAQVDLDPLPPPEDSFHPAVISGQTSNIRITSSVDLPKDTLTKQDQHSLSGRECPTNEELDISNWVDDRPFHLQIGEARRGLYGEFDTLNHKTAVQLAKIYIHFSFGAEALRVLSLDPEQAQPNARLRGIAHIMERGHSLGGSGLRSLLDCESDAALWAILAHEDFDVAEIIDPKPALRALNKLPVHLRKFLAPALSQRLLSHGDSDAASTALRSLERLPSDLPPAAKLARAQIAIDDGDIAKANSTLADVIDDNATQSPEALIALVETQLNADQPVDFETASLIEAYAKELRGSALGADLRRAHVLALLQSDQFDRAFEAADELEGKAEDEAAIDLRLTLLKHLTTSAGDITFLDHVFAQSLLDIGRMPLRNKLSLVTRLADLGFAQQAATILAEIPSHPRTDARQLLAARIALDLHQPNLALAELVNLTGDQIDQLRARALRIAGNHADAYSLYRAIEDNAAAAQVAWWVDDWENLTKTDDQLLGSVLALSDLDIAPSTDPKGMLARSAAALDESQAARNTLANLLRDPEIEVAADISLEVPPS